MTTQKLPLSLSPAPVGRGFFAASSSRHTSETSFQGKKEGAAQRQFRRSARQVSVFDPVSVQLSFFPVSAPAQRVRY